MGKVLGRASLLVGSLVIVWLSISSASVLVLLSGASPEACAFWRLTLSIPLLYLLELIRGNRLPACKLRLHHVVSGISLGLHFMLWMHSLFLVPVYVSTLLVTLYPLYSLLIEAVILRKGLTPLQVVGLVVCSVLLALYLGVYELTFTLGALEAIIAGVLAAVYFEVGSYARRRLREQTVPYALSTYFVAAVFVLVLSFFKGSTVIYYEPAKYAYFILLALVPMVFGHTLMNYLLGKYPAPVVTSISYGEPFGAGLLAYLLLGQSITPVQVLLGVLIMVLVFITATAPQLGGRGENAL